MINQEDELVDQSGISQLTVEVFERLGVANPTAAQTALLHSLFSYISVHQEIRYNSSLSAREKTCLYLLAHGKNLEQIAQDMQIKRTTVVTFIKRIKIKLRCDTLPQAVFIGMGYRDMLGKDHFLRKSG